MFEKKGFTLIEIIVVIIIMAAIAAYAIPQYMTTMAQGEAKAAENNLIIIYDAEKSYYLSKAAYCTTATGSPCDSLSDINNNLPLNGSSLNITDKYFTNYTCATTNGFQCTATDPNIKGFSLTVTNNPIVLIGATGCTTYASATCNPVCSPWNNVLCPAA